MRGFALGASSAHPHAWLKVFLVLLAAEKVIQHVFVTFAFYGDVGGIRATVAMDYRVLMAGGALIAVLFVVALWLLWRNPAQAARLLVVLACVDIVGEFLAQGKLLIEIPVSWLVAILLLFTALLYLRAAQRTA